MYGLDERIIDLEYITKDYRIELRRMYRNERFIIIMW